MELYGLLDGMEHAELALDVNYLKIPVTTLRPTEENAKLFNDILGCLRSNPDYTEIVRTKSGGISRANGNLNFPSYDYTKTSSSAELTILDEMGMYRIQFRSGVVEDGDGDKMSGRKAFAKFKSLLLYNGVDLDDYEIEDGFEVKATIEKPLIMMANSAYKDGTFEHVYHIDFHNSYPAGLANTHPEFRKTIEMLYAKRKDDPVYKAILNFSIGFMQSKWCNARYAQLSRDAIGDNNKRLRDLTAKIERFGGIPLLYNTDGCWFYFENPKHLYHDRNEGDKLGQWHYDHCDCTFRIKSDGAYEYIEDGKYCPVVRGCTNLDKIKPREQWVWGDIYQTEVITFHITDNGIRFKGDSQWVER